jgi:hypothetical protein
MYEATLNLKQDLEGAQVAKMRMADREFAAANSLY